MKFRFIVCFLCVLPILMFKLLVPISQYILRTETLHLNLKLANNCNMSLLHLESEIISEFKKLVPPLSNHLHKGQMGRVGVIGGSEEYTGGPYFSAMSMLKLGADLSHVFSTQAASPVIKSYSPELIVHPLLDKENGLEEIREWLPRLHAVVIGPGLGRLQGTLSRAKEILKSVRALNLPVVIDADGILLIEQEPMLIEGYSKAIITPNRNEFNRLTKAMSINNNRTTKPDNNCTITETIALSKALKGVTVVRKGPNDIIAKDDNVMVVDRQGSPRRCGGQGDLLSGAAALFSFWAHQKPDHGTNNPSMLSAFAGCYITRGCAARAFAKHGRSVTTTDLINEIHTEFDANFETTL